MSFPSSLIICLNWEVKYPNYDTTPFPVITTTIPLVGHSTPPFLPITIPRNLNGPKRNPSSASRTNHRLSSSSVSILASTTISLSMWLILGGGASRLIQRRLHGPLKRSKVSKDKPSSSPITHYSQLSKRPLEIELRWGLRTATSIPTSPTNFSKSYRKSPVGCGDMNTASVPSHREHSEWTGPSSLATLPTRTTIKIIIRLTFAQEESQSLTINPNMALHSQIKDGWTTLR